MIFEEYLNSSNFNNLCLALDFLPEDVDEIKKKASEIKEDRDSESSIASIIYEQMLKYKDVPSKEICHSSRYFRWLSMDSSMSQKQYLFQVLIRDRKKWDDIEHKLKAGILSGKICSDYLFEKEYQKELDSIMVLDTDDALNAIYMHEIYHLVKMHRIPEEDVGKVYRYACLNGYLANPLCFDDVKKAFEESLQIIFNMPLDRIGDFSLIMNGFFIVENETLTRFAEEIFKKSDESYPDDFADWLFVQCPFVDGKSVFYVISCGGSYGIKPRSDFSDVVCIDYDLVENSKAFRLSKDSDLVSEFSDFIIDYFYKKYSNLEEGKKEILDDFMVETIENTEDAKTWYLLNALENDYDSSDLFEIASQKPLSMEFLGLISSLNLSIDDALKIQKNSRDSSDVMEMLNKKVYENFSRDNLSKKELSNQLERLYIKAILLLKYSEWDEIKDELAAKIDSGEISSSYDLHLAFDDVSKSDFKANIKNAQIEALLDFREMDFSYAKDLAFYLQDKDILENGLGEYLNEISNPVKKKKAYPDKGKYAAPRWLVYPQLDAYTIGWRMGYGEEYAMNEPYHDEKFSELFPMPRNWLFNPRDSDIERFSLFSYFWTPDGKPKYSKIEGDYVEVNEFITVEQTDCEFQCNSIGLKSIEHALLLSKYSLFFKISPHHISLNTLKRGFELTDEQINEWQQFKYSVLLNASYYKFMENEDLKQKLLDTGDRPLVYVSDDEWGGEDNLFGFALMELRDEINRLYENENLIDWQYTEYLKYKDPYENPQRRNPEDKQSSEYMAIATTLSTSKEYVRDTNLSDEVLNKYEIGQVLTEKTFADSTDRIGGLATDHRFLILSNQMKDLSGFENGTNWGLHITYLESKFKVLDIYTKEEKTQILLLQLPEGFEEVFENKISLIDEAIENAREMFDECLKEGPIPEVSSEEWLERVSYPIGMDDNGNMF